MPPAGIRFTSVLLLPPPHDCGPTTKCLFSPIQRCTPLQFSGQFKPISAVRSAILRAHLKAKICGTNKWACSFFPSTFNILFFSKRNCFLVLANYLTQAYYFQPIHFPILKYSILIRNKYPHKSFPKDQNNFLFPFSKNIHLWKSQV